MLKIIFKDLMILIIIKLMGNSNCCTTISANDPTSTKGKDKTIESTPIVLTIGD